MVHFLLSTIMILLMPWCIKAMHSQSLNVIEKQLVSREISVRGIAAIEKQIDPPIFTKKIANQRLNVPPAMLKISVPLCKDDSDPLTIIIFEKIEKTEKQYGYRPKKEILQDGHYYIEQKSTNHLGNYSRYYWYDETHDIVLIKAKISNKQELTEIIKEEKNRLQKALVNNAHNTSS